VESAEPLRTAMSVCIKLDDLTLGVGIISKCVLPAQLPVLFRKVRIPPIPGTTSMIRSLPGLGRIRQWRGVSRTAKLRDEKCECAVVAYAASRAVCITTSAGTQVQFYVKCDIFTVVRKIGVGQLFLSHVPNMKFNDNAFGGNRVAPFEFTDGRTDVARLTVVIRLEDRP
jgi:hypothetical protein